jgi:hypothetical protein
VRGEKGEEGREGGKRTECVQDKMKRQQQRKASNEGRKHDNTILTARAPYYKNESLCVPFFF